MPILRSAVLFTITVLTGLAVAIAPPANGNEGPPVPEASELIALVRQTISAVDAGNKTGDYSALHTMGGPAFKTAYPPTKLAENFAKLRGSGTDLARLKDKLPLTSRPPVLDREGRLRILGYYELPDKQIVYDVLYDFEPTSRRWLLAAVSVSDRILLPQPELMQPR